MPKLLCATDLLPKSEAAVERAGRLAERLGAQLTLLHVVSPANAQCSLEQSLQSAAAKLNERTRPPQWQHGPPPRTLVRAGNPARMIREVIEQRRPDLAIIGPHRKRALRDVLEGTLAEKILSSRQTPLLIVQGLAEAEYRNVLLALDISLECGSAVRAAESLVMASSTQAMVMHVCDPPYQGMMRSAGVAAEKIASYVEQSRYEAALAIRELLKRESADHSRYAVVIGESHPVPTIRRALEMYQPDLLVIGTAGIGRLRRALVGSVANQILDAALCDVLVVPRGSVPR
jgi:universal stress protein E